MSSISRSMRAQFTYRAGPRFSRNTTEDVEVGAGRGTARVSPSRRLQRPSALPRAAPALARRIVGEGGETPFGAAELGRGPDTRGRPFRRAVSAGGVL